MRFPESCLYLLYMEPVINKLCVTRGCRHHGGFPHVVMRLAENFRGRFFQLSLYRAPEFMQVFTLTYRLYCQSSTKIEMSRQILVKLAIFNSLFLVWSLKG